MKPSVQAFFDPATWTVSYVVYDAPGGSAAIVEMPNLILPSIQVNIRAGEPPPPEANGVSYLKIPLNAL
jgi:hypothetical protein